MPEQGIVTAASIDGGAIDSGNPPPVNYEVGVTTIIGPLPRVNQRVSFERSAADPSFATRVQVTSLAVAEQLDASFHARLGPVAIAADGREEVARIAADRAARVLRPLADRAEPSTDVAEARLALAQAAMALMAVEAGSQGEVTAKSLRDALRGQRPKLPRG